MSDLSEYEKKRLAKIAERNKLLQSLDINSTVNSLKAVAPPKPLTKEPTPKKPRTRTPSEPLVRREPSRRLQNKPPVSYKEGVINVQGQENEEEVEIEIKDERTLGKYEMRWEEESLDGSLFLKTEVAYDPNICLLTCSPEELCSQLASFSLIEPLPKLVPERVQSLTVHKSPKLRLVLAGGKSGSVGLWNIDSSVTASFDPHTAAVNCLVCSQFSDEKFYSVSFDGTILCGEIEKGLFTNVHAENFHDRITHLTWADELDANTLLIAHGNGSIGILDLREGKKVKWNNCFERSCRTIQHHPIKSNYVLAASGIGQCKIWDMKNFKEELIDLKHKKGLASSFFSATGGKVLTTANDDMMRIFEVDVDKGTGKEAAVIPHNNHTGRWLSVFKAKWFPGRDDMWITGSLLQPRRLQIFNGKKLVSEIRHDSMVTVNPVLDVHPSLRLIAGGNSSGRIHVFCQPT